MRFRIIGDDRTENELAEPVRGGDTQKAFEMLALPRQLSLQRECLFLHALGVDEYGRPLVRQHEAVARPLEQCVTYGGLQRLQPPTHRWLGLPDRACSGAESSRARDGE